MAKSLGDAARQGDPQARSILLAAAKANEHLDALYRAQGDDDARAAYDLATIALRALATPSPEQSALVRRLLAIAAGFKDHDSDTLAIYQLAQMVEIAAGQRTLVHIPARARGRDTTVGAHAPTWLREWLVKQYPRARVPTVKQIAELLDAHSHHGARGRLTTKGIVADLMIAMHLHGVTQESERKDVLRRVDTYLRRVRERSTRRVE